jgi:hypothetical protein
VSWLVRDPKPSSSSLSWKRLGEGGKSRSSFKISPGVLQKWVWPPEARSQSSSQQYNKELSCKLCWPAMGRILKHWLKRSLGDV